jgi:hypothetical protein
MQRREFLMMNIAAAIGPCGDPWTATTWPGDDHRPGPLRAGCAERDITPKADSIKFHDSCKARAAVFDDGARRVALVGVDVIGVPRYLVLEVREGIQKRCGIPPEAVLIGASHTHSGGFLARDGANRSQPVPPGANAFDGGPGYNEHVQAQIIEAVAAADAAKGEARCGVGSGHEDKVAFNRRQRMRNGLSWTHAGKGNPDILGYAGPTDPEVGVIGIWNKQDQLTGCIVNFACHATTGTGGVSADWICYMERAIRQVMGAEVVVVFMQGCCGDVTQVDNLSPNVREFGEPSARFVGGRVGLEAVKALISMQPGKMAPLDTRQTVLQIPYRVPSAEHVARANAIVGGQVPNATPTDLRFARSLLSHAERLKERRTEEVEVQAIQVGPAVFISNPSELFCQFGLDIKKGSPFPKTFPVELANGSVGYVPTEDALGPHGGGYETRLGVSRLEVAAGRKMVEAGLALARQMKPGVVPEWPKEPPFDPKEGGIGNTPWSYGDVPPEVS